MLILDTSSCSFQSGVCHTEILKIYLRTIITQRFSNLSLFSTKHRLHENVTARIIFSEIKAKNQV